MKQKSIEKIKNQAIRRAFDTSRVQARYRNQDWLLTWEEFYELWNTEDRWTERGVYRESLVMSRVDLSGPWELSNVEIITRLDMLRKEAKFKKELKCK